MAVRLQFAAKDGPESIDKHVGRRVRMRRQMLAMSQQKLGAALGLTFQQVQKYERGATRISASRLQHLSQILQVPVAFFFEGLPNASAPYESSESALSIVEIDDFVSGSNGLRLISALRLHWCASFPCRTRHTHVANIHKTLCNRRTFFCFHRLITAGTSNDRRVIHTVLHSPSPRSRC